MAALVSGSGCLNIFPLPCALLSPIGSANFLAEAATWTLGHVYGKEILYQWQDSNLPQENLDKLRNLTKTDTMAGSPMDLHVSTSLSNEYFHEIETKVEYGVSIRLFDSA